MRDPAAVDLRQFLLRMHLHKGRLLDETGERTTSLVAYREALSLAEGLATAWSNNPLVRSDLAALLRSPRTLFREAEPA